MSPAKGKRRSYSSFFFIFDEFFSYCQDFYNEFGHLDVSENWYAIKDGDSVKFVNRPSPEQNALKVYDIGEKVRIARRAINSGQFKQGKIIFTQDQFDKLSSLDPDWRYSGSSDYNEFYYYCKLYYETFGDLNVPHRFVAIKNEDGSIRFAGNTPNISKDGKQQVVFAIGNRLLKFAFSRGRLSKRSEFLIDRQVARLKAMDPYWDYPRNYVGMRVDPITKKVVDKEKITPSIANRTNTMFDFDEFYSYLLLYNARFGSMNINSKCVYAEDHNGIPQFVRMELAKLENMKIIYKLGWHLKELIYYRNYSDKNPNSVRHLTEGQYRKLDELCPGWSTAYKEDLGFDHVTQEWIKYCEVNGIKKAQKRNVASTEKTRKVRDTKAKPYFDLKASVGVEDDEDKQEQTDSKAKSKPKEIKCFDYDLFYSLCKKQKEIIGELSYSKSKVVSITTNDLNEETDYPIGMIFHIASQTRYYDEKRKEGVACEPPELFLHLTDEQNNMLDELDKFWFYPYVEQKRLRVAERAKLRGERKRIASEEFSKNS